MSRVWAGVFPIHIYELDPSYRLAVPAVCGFLQEAAAHNAHALGWFIPQLTEKNLTWVLSRLRLRMHEYPGWKAHLTVETWPSGQYRLFALRDFRVLLDGRQIGAATSAWLLIDIPRRRPIRPDSFFTDWGALIHPERALAVDLEKVPELEESNRGEAWEREITVRYCDLDVNLHANNMRHVEWILESIPPEVLRELSPAELDIDFLSEAGQGDRILSRCRLGSDGAYAHVLLRNGQEVARARTVWRRR